MKKIFQEYLKKFMEHREAAGTAAALLLLLLLLGSVFAGLQGQKQQIPQNPITGKENSSLVMLAGVKEVLADNIQGLKGRVSAAQRLESTEAEQQEEEKETERQEESESQSNGESVRQNPDGGTEVLDSRTNTSDDRRNTPAGSSQNPVQNSAGDGTGENPASGGQNGGKDKNVTPTGEKDTEYFRTTIQNGAVLSVPDYSYEIEHLTKRKVKHIKNTLNDGKASAYNGTLRLAKGKNTVLVAVTYLDEEGMPFTVSKEYTLYFEPEQLVIQTNLSDCTVKKDTISFQAYGQLGEEEFSLKASLNGQELTVGENYQYTAAGLLEGENRIVLTTEHNGQRAEAAYAVVYEKPQEQKIRFDTSLQDEEVKKKKYSFYAQAYMGSEKLETLAVEKDGVLLEKSEDGNYEVLLEEGENTFTLTAEKGTVTESVSYTVTYIKQALGDGDGEGNPDAPEVTCTLGESGTNLNTDGSVLSFEVFPRDYKDKPLGASSISIVSFGDNGDNEVVMVWENQGDISFKAYLTPGNNTLIIYVTDEEDNTAELIYSIFCTASQAGDPIGTAHISVEATTVGSGILLSEDVEIFEGETASHAVMRLLESCGYRANYTGTLDSGFYLKYIESDTDFVSGAIPDDLRAKLEENYSEKDLHLDHFYTNSLGEFDFTSKSGWMYQVNGVYPNYGLSDCYLQNGDEMRIRFTLALGADIGGAGVTGNGSNEGEAQGWGYEW